MTWNKPSAAATRVLGALLLCIPLSSCFDHASPESSWTTNDKGIYSGALSRDGSYVLLGTEGQGGGLWDAEYGDRIYRWNHSKNQASNLVACSFSADGKYALTADNSTLVLWRVETGESLRFFDTPAPIALAQLSADGNFALLALEDQSVVFFDIQQGGVLQRFAQSAQALSMALSPRNDLAFVALQDGTTRTYDLLSGISEDRLGLNGRIKTAVFSGSGEYLFVSGSNVEPTIWDVGRGRKFSSIGQKKRILPGYFSYLAARFSEDDSRLLTGNASGQVQLWNVATGNVERQWLMPKSSFWLPKSFAIIDVAINSVSHNYVALTSGGAIHNLR